MELSPWFGFQVVTLSVVFVALVVYVVVSAVTSSYWMNRRSLVELWGANTLFLSVPMLFVLPTSLVEEHYHISRAAAWGIVSMPVFIAVACIVLTGIGWICWALRHPHTHPTEMGA